MPEPPSGGPGGALVSPPAQASHIFIVGLSRSGTTLTRAVLNAHPSIGIAAAESHFFDGAEGPTGIRHRMGTSSGQAGILRDDAAIGRVLNSVYRAPESRFWGRVAAVVDRPDLEVRLKSSDRTDRALFDLAMEYHAAGKPIRGEKTPQHVLAVPTLLEWFPNARIVHVLRDPRAVYVSLRRKQMEWDERGRPRSWAGKLVRRLGPVGDGYVMTKLIFDFRRVLRLHREYQVRYPGRYLMLQFEQLVGDPGGAVRRLCEYIGVPYSEAMLGQVVRNSSFSPTGASGIDSTIADRWRHQLSRLAQRWFALLCSREMAELGYVP